MNTEILAHQISNNNLIQGITIKNYKEKLSQFLDDMNIFTINDQKNLQEIINVLDRLTKNTGLRVNYDKTTIFKIGPSVNMPNLKISKVFKWSSTDIRILGVTLKQTESMSDMKNITHRMQAITNMWQQRGLSLVGKTVIANALMGSLPVYRMQMMPLIDNNDEYNINQILQNFIWSGRKPKI